MREIKIDTELVQGRVVEFKPNIYVFEIPDDYERAMLFCRHQEHYESPFEDIRGCAFTLEYYMNKYRKQNKKNTFTYPSDWIGFNIPGNTLLKGFTRFSVNNVFNDYDRIFGKYIDLIVKNVDSEFYIIGVKSLNEISTLNHELSHAFFHTNGNYRINCEQIIDEMEIKMKDDFYAELINMGYSSDLTLLKDELQAYMSTGLNSNLKNVICDDVDSHQNTIYLQYIIKKFEDNFNNFTKEL